MAVKSKYNGLSRAMSILNDYKRFCKTQSDEVERAKAQGMMFTPEKRQEMDSKRELQRKSSLKELDMIKEQYRELLKTTVLPFPVADDGTICGFSRGELSFLQSLQYISPDADMMQEYLRAFHRDGSNRPMEIALVAKCKEMGFEVAGVDLRSVDERAEEFNKMIDKVAFSLRDDLEDYFNMTTAQMYIDEVEQATEVAYAEGTGNRRADLITVTSPEEVVLDALGVPVEKVEEPETDPEMDEAFRRGFDPESYNQDMQVQAVAAADMARRTNRENEIAERSANNPANAETDSAE